MARDLDRLLHRMSSSPITTSGTAEPDLGDGVVFGALAGMAASLASVVFLFASWAAVWAISPGSGDTVGPEPGYALVLIAFVAFIVATPLGLVVGGVVGGLLAGSHAVETAPWFAAFIAALAGVFLGQLILDAEAAGAIAVWGIFTVMVTLFGVSGWFAGRWFTRMTGT